MIPFSGHPIVRTGIAAFFTAGFTYATAVAVGEGSWEDVLFLLPLLLLIGFGLRNALTVLQAWRRSRLAVQDPIAYWLSAPAASPTSGDSKSTLPSLPTTRLSIWAGRSLLGAAAGMVLTWLSTLGSGERRGLFTIGVVAVGVFLFVFAALRLPSSRPPP